MEDEKGKLNNLLTSLREHRNQILPWNTRNPTDENSSPRNIKLSRRSYLLATGVVTTFVGSYAGAVGSVSGSTVSTFSYGGTLIVSQSSSVPELEPNDYEGKAMPLSSGTTVNGELTVNDHDWYTIEATSGDTVTFEFTRASSSGVTVIIIYTPTKALKDVRSVTSDKPVSFDQTATTDGNIYVQIIDTHNSDSNYILTVGGETSGTPHDDSIEQTYGDYGYGGITA